MVDPIIINLKNNHIIGGHQRYNVLQDQYIQNNEFDVEKIKNRLNDRVASDVYRGRIYKKVVS